MNLDAAHFARGGGGRRPRRSSLVGSTAGRLAIVGLGLALYLPGIRWGMPALYSWSQDTIAGPARTAVVEGWPRDWRGRYPPLHYFVNAAAYRAVEQLWKWQGVMTIDPASGAKILAPPHAPKVGLLFLLSRLISAAMAIGVGMALFSVTRLLGGDGMAALLAALVMMLGADFGYFARLGNVDVPSLFWFSWCIAFYLRLLGFTCPEARISACATLPPPNTATEAKNHGLPRAPDRAAPLARRDPFEPSPDSIWGIFPALAVALLAAAATLTKEGVAGALPGMALALLVFEYRRIRWSQPGESRLPSAARALFQFRWLVGLAVFLVVYLYGVGAFHNWGRYLTRMHYWLDPSANTLQAQQHRYTGPLDLAWATIRYAAEAVGWPMLAAMLASAAWAALRLPRTALALLLPAFSYYFITIVWAMGFLYARFLHPILFLAAPLTGLMMIAMIRRPGVRPSHNGSHSPSTLDDPWAASAGPSRARAPGPGMISVAAVLMMTTGYSFCVTLDMIHDSRYDVEAWFDAHIPRDRTIGVFSKPQYLPRLVEAGYDVRPLEPSSEAVAALHPDVIVMTSYNDEERGETGEELIKFLAESSRHPPGAPPKAGAVRYRLEYVSRRHLYLGKSWLGLAGWGVEPIGKISPGILVYIREPSIGD